MSFLIKLNLYLLKIEAFNGTLSIIYFTKRYFLKKELINIYFFRGNPLIMPTTLYRTFLL